MNFCESCYKDIEIEILNKKMSSIIFGIEYEYNGKIAICKDCKNEVYTHYTNDYNLSKLYEVFKSVNP